MGKRKVFRKTDLTVPEVACASDRRSETTASHDALPPAETIVRLERNANGSRSFDFARWYSAGIDTITYACQRQVERFLAKQDADVQASTVSNYCKNGLRTFLEYMVLRATALGRELTLSDVRRNAIDGYISHLASSGTATTGQRARYLATKSVLLALARRGLIDYISKGDDATFPVGPYPNINRKYKGESPLPKKQREAFTAAVKTAVMPLWDDHVEITAELLAYALLIVALHTGRNTTPLLEMGRDCFRSHPKDATVFLVLWKRRGNNTSKVALRVQNEADRVIESTPAVRSNVERLIRRVLSLTAALQPEAPEDLSDRVWLYRSRRPQDKGAVTALTDNSIEPAVRRLVADNNLTEPDGTPLRINVSRLRKTFANRIYELLDGDLATTAIALGNTPSVAGRNYLVPSDESRRNWRFMGSLLVKELLTRTIGSTYRATPMGGCEDAAYGQFAPKKPGATCFSFLNCLRCKHYVVTGDDLYKLYSFYFRILAERNRLPKRQWNQAYAHIPRLIDDYIVAEGVRRKVFSRADVSAARERARCAPHPFWSVDELPSLEVFK